MKNKGTMTTLELTNRTFCKEVKRTIATKLDKVVKYRKVNNKLVALIGAEGNTIAQWQQTRNGSRVILNSWY